MTFKHLELIEFLDENNKPCKAYYLSGDENSCSVEIAYGPGKGDVWIIPMSDILDQYEDYATEEKFYYFKDMD